MCFVATEGQRFGSAMLLVLLACCWGKRTLDHGGMRGQRGTE